MEIWAIFNTHKTWYGYCKYLARSLGTVEQFCGSCVINADLITMFWCQQRSLLRCTSCTTQMPNVWPWPVEVLFPSILWNHIVYVKQKWLCNQFCIHSSKVITSEFSALRVMWINCRHLQCSEITLESTCGTKAT